MTAAPTKTKTEQILIRVSPETYSVLQLAQPFVGKRSMQDLICVALDDFLAKLRNDDAGFKKAVAGLRESEARRPGVPTRRTPGETRRAKGDAREDDTKQ